MVVKKIVPTDITRYVDLDKCERYLYFRLHKDALHGRIFSEVKHDPIPPILKTMGEKFEREVEAAIAHRYSLRRLPLPEKGSLEVLKEVIARLPAGGVVFLAQVALSAEINGWVVDGTLDLLRLRRDRRGRLSALIIDAKCSSEVKVEHKLQVVFYRLLLETVFQNNGIDCSKIRTAVVYRGSRDYFRVKDDAERAKLRRHRKASLKLLAAPDAFLEFIDDYETYRYELEDLVLGPKSKAESLLAAKLEDLDFSLDQKCDTCSYNTYCMRWCEEYQDLALLPFINVTDRKALISKGIKAIPQLAALGIDEGNVQAKQENSLKAELFRLFDLGARLDELIFRANVWLHSRNRSTYATQRIPTKRHSSLPHSDLNMNSNLVMVYLDAQKDYFQERVFMLGALVVAYAAGAPKRRRYVVKMTDSVPDTAEKEMNLYCQWTGELLDTIVEIAEPTLDGWKKAPIHMVFFDRLTWQHLLDGMSRHLSDVFGTTSLYDFITQVAAYDSPVITFLTEEIRSFSAYPLVSHSLQQLACYLGYSWRDEKRDYKKLFHERLFDWAGVLDGKDGKRKYTAKARFSSTIPLEYAYVAWRTLQADKEFEKYGKVSI